MTKAGLTAPSRGAVGRGSRSQDPGALLAHCPSLPVRPKKVHPLSGLGLLFCQVGLMGLTAEGHQNHQERC